MAEAVLLTTQDLEVAGGLREAFREEGVEARFVVSEDDLRDERDAGVLVLTGKPESQRSMALATTAREDLRIPVFGVFPGSEEGIRERAQALGLDEAFRKPLDVDTVVLLARRALQRRHLQGLTGIIGESDAIREVLERVVQIAPVDSTVLLTGESGTGKELVSRGIHALSPRKHRAFIPVNVAALPETLLESELFGHQKGAFTGAVDSRKGLFELADRGTIFLDEMGEMPLVTQTKLLRVLEQREFLRVGGESPIRVDVRIIAATNQNLRYLVNTGDFRRDLYHRLNVLHIELPPLRSRREDVPLLVEHFIREVSEDHDRPFVGITPEALEILVDYDWPGNIRELRNLVESMVVLNPGRAIEPSDIPREVLEPAGERGGGGSTFLPAPVRGPGAVPFRPFHGTGPGGALAEPVRGGAPAGRAELEFVFRTLVDLRMDMDELRREFERYTRTHPPAGGREVEAEPPSPGGGPAEPPHPPGPEVRIHGPGTGVGAPVFDDVEDVEEVEVIASGPDSLALPDGSVVFRPGMTMEDLERQAVEMALQQVGGNRRRAAEMLGIGERTLYRKIAKYGLESPGEGEGDENGPEQDSEA